MQQHRSSQAMEEEKKQKKLPIDARLLSEAVIELNISRRSVRLYPPEHPIAKESINRAFELLKNLFEMRSSITLGIAKNTLVIDEYTLDKKNPVFSEFALSLHDKGLAAITFYNGLEVEEIVSLHELITMREGPTGKALLENAEKKGIRHIQLGLIDLSKFDFIQGAFKPGALESKLWEDYVYGLLEGKLAENEAEGIILTIPPEQIAVFINSHISEDTPDETYDRVISTYLRRKGRLRLNKETFDRFLSFIYNLSPELKSQFLKRAFCNPHSETAEIEALAELTEKDIQRVLEVFNKQSLELPESLMNVLTKLTTAKSEGKFLSDLGRGETIVDDIEIDENIAGLLKERSDVFVSEQYKRDLEMMLRGFKAEEGPLSETLRQECGEKVIDLNISETMLELLESDSINNNDCLNLLTKLSELANAFLETGRFQELCDIYNGIYSHSLSGRFKVEASSMLDYFYRSNEFISRLVEAFKFWGRYDREGAVRLARGLKQYLLSPLLDALSTESDPSVRKFLLHVISTFGSDVIPEAVRRLNDERWYVVRNMIYLLRECGGEKYLKQCLNHIKKLAKDKNNKICIEAVKTLLEFDTPIAPSYLKHYLRSKNFELRQQAVMLAGAYKVKDAVPYLIELLVKKDPFGTESYYKVSIVKALAEIGDPRAIDPLKKIYNSKALLYRGILDELKIEIFRTLQSYPRIAIRPLLELGVNSKNKEIRSICENLLKGSIPTEHKGA